MLILQVNESYGKSAYKQGVTGSNPVGPTSLRKPRNESCGVFAFPGRKPSPA